MIMRNLLLTIVMAVASTTAAGAQSFLQHLRQRQQGQGVVTVNESQSVDSLVDNITPPPARKPEQPARKNDKATEGRPKNDEPKGEAPRKEQASPVHEQARTEYERARTDYNRHTPEAEENTTVDKRKKVMLNGHRANGYRVQVYRGGGTRNAKQKAQSLGNSLKAKFPGQPVYVHFFSPNWTVRMGNYRSQEEAVRMLRQAKKAGFGSATIVRGPITVSR